MNFFVILCVLLNFCIVAPTIWRQSNVKIVSEFETTVSHKSRLLYFGAKNLDLQKAQGRFDLYPVYTLHLRGKLWVYIVQLYIRW